tara:strand:- start:329 stop:1426 length:1098 start_codon:yes stop_codon:yes gene_type:complete
VIYLVLLDVTLKGGIERVATSFANYLIKNNVDVKIISFFQSHKKPFYYVDPKVKFIYLSKIKFTRLVTWLFTPLLIKRLFYNIKQPNKSPIIIYYAGIIPFLWIISPRILPFLTYSEHLSFDTAGIPVRFVRRFFLKRIKSVHVINKYSQSEYKKIGIKSKYIPNPITIFNSQNQFKYKVNINPPKKVFNIISIGRLEEVKNFLDVLKIASLFNEIYNVKFNIYGDGPLREFLIKESRKLNLENLTFNAFASDIAHVYSSADFIIMTSLSEALPMALLEAMSFGVIPIAYNDLDGPKDIINNNKNGFLCPREDFDFIKNLILDLIQNNNKFNLISNKAVDSSLDYYPENINTQFLNSFIKNKYKY